MQLHQTKKVKRAAKDGDQYSTTLARRRCINTSPRIGCHQVARRDRNKRSGQMMLFRRLSSLPRGVERPCLAKSTELPRRSKPKLMRRRLHLDGYVFVRVLNNGIPIAHGSAHPCLDAQSQLPQGGLPNLELDRLPLHYSEFSQRAQDLRGLPALSRSP